MGEDSKKSGENGEALTSALLDRIGWKTLMKNVSIDCNTPTHLNAEGNQRRTHGEDQIFLYHNPFHDERTDVVHISDKNVSGKYARGNTLKSQFKSHLKELHQTIDCAKYSPKLKDFSITFGAKKNSHHSGLLVWLQNDRTEIEQDIISELANTRLEMESDNPIYIVDNARAAFLLKVVDDLKRRSGEGHFEFYYPRIGTAVSFDTRRTGAFLPLELIAADIIPAIVQSQNNKVEKLLLYTREPYSEDAYKRLIVYGLNFAAGLVNIIYIGMPDYNPATHEPETKQARMAFHERSEEVYPFCYNRSILDLLEVSHQ